VEDKRSTRQRRVDLERMLRVLDLLLREARPRADRRRIATLERIMRGLLARRPKPFVKLFP
jgi:hypothetical protein